MKWKVLLVEDDLEMQKVICRSLENVALEMTCSTKGSDAFELLKTEHFDLVLLDIGLPDANGFQLCTQLRSSLQTRDLLIIFITAKEDVLDRVMGFSLGADDYIVKPFDPRELSARVESKLKRFRMALDSQRVTKGDLQLSLALQQASFLNEGRATDLALTPSEFRLLYYFVSHEDEVLTREQLLKALWEGHGVHVLERTIDRHIAALRKKLASKTHEIQTVSRMGYRFSALVKQQSSGF